ncbi:hypothetical protein Barb7_01441 [Bacteroidales bacterium Barb7]|nr:hypothetical protein Barb6XT_01378 [Bacteroidales bacterium Barb6XT]OAV74989.1 hypothetical protein Barb7_01441 [Bacteroidales bacterium Barb7]
MENQEQPQGTAQKEMKEMFARFFLDIAKLIFATLVLGNILAIFFSTEEIWKILCLIVIGFFGTVSSALMAYNTIKQTS